MKKSCSNLSLIKLVFSLHFNVLLKGTGGKELLAHPIERANY